MDTIRVCPSCGKPLAADAPQGICPECLMKAGFGTASGTEGGADPGFVPPTVEAMSKLFPQLEVLEFIGKGGMGAVYKARQPGLDRLVALKILPPRAGDDPGFAERFTREARALAKLTHPNIVAVYDFGQAGPTPEAAQPASRLHYFLMEYVEGPNLRQLERAGRLTPRDAMRIIPQICEALQYAHDEGIVHRDIKPENVLLDKRGKVKIADFGLAKILGREPQNFRLTSAGQIMGTPHYMAPEQVEDPQAVDHRADIYSLGVVFYEMITGELPLGKFAPPSCKVQMDVRLDEVVLHALEKEPDRRYQHASQVKTDVETIATTAASQPPTQPAKGRMSTDTRKGLLYGLGAAACLVIGLPIWFLLATHGAGNAGQLSQDGWQLWQARQWDAAAAKFHQAIKADPKETNAWNGLGWASFNSGRWPEAEEAFQRCLALDPNAPGALNGLGQLYLGKKEYDLAETYLLKAAPQAPAAWYGLARLYLLQGKYDKAAEWASKIVDSGQADEGVKQMLKAAREKHVPDGLRLMIEPQAQAEEQSPRPSVAPAAEKGGLARMMSQKMQDPAGRESLRVQQRSLTDQLYAPLVARMGLTPVEADQFKDMLTDHMMNACAKSYAALAAPASAHPAPSADSLAADQKRFDAHLKGFLGDTRYAQYEAYQETIDQRAQLNYWRLTAGSDYTLTEPQTEALLTIMKEEQDKVRATAGLAVAGADTDPSKLKGQFSDSNIERLMRAQETMTQRVYDRARSMLSLDQLASFARFQTNLLKGMSASMGLMKGLYGADKSAGPRPELPQQQ